jgi:hypothetical protein
MKADEFYMALGACAALSNPFADCDIAAASEKYAAIIRSLAETDRIGADSSLTCHSDASAS